MFYQIFFSPQVKRCAIITYQYGMYELTHELPNDLRFTQESLKTPQNNRPVPSPPAKMKILLILAKKLLKSRN